MDLLGPLLATPSPGAAELHDQDVAFELIEGIPLTVNPLELETRGGFPDQAALSGLGLARDDLRETTEQGHHQHATATRN
jgi:hypothetical protein